MRPTIPDIDYKRKVIIKSAANILVAVCFFITGCSDEYEVIPQVGTETTLIASHTVTRNFLPGDRIGIYPVEYIDYQLGVPGDIFNPLNLPMVFINGQWKPENDDYLFIQEDILEVFAYYPYDPELANSEGKLDLRNYPVDLSIQTSIESADMLWARNIILALYYNTADLQFNHLFSKLTITLNITGSNINDIKADIYNFRPRCTVNLTDGSVKTETNTSVINNIPVTGQTAESITFEAIVPPQSIATGTPLFLFHIGERVTSYTIDRPLTLEAGVNYTFILTVNPVTE